MNHRRNPWLSMLVSLALLTPCALAKPAPPRGVYGLTNTHNWVTVNGKRIDLFPLVPSGLTNYALCRGVESTQGVYNWQGLDRLLEESRRADKKLAYGVLAGSHAPDWVYQLPGVLSWTMTKNGKPARCYLPWTEVNGRRVLNEALLKQWDQTVAAFAAKIHSVPDYRQRIAYIPITGGPSSNGLEVMWAAPDYGEFASLHWGKQEDQLLAEYWERCIDIFMNHFPDLPLGLAVNDYVGRLPSGEVRRNLTVAKAVLDYGVAEAQRCGIQFMPMGLWVESPGLRNLNHPLTKLLFSYASRCPIGLQGPLATKNVSELRAMLDFALQNKASWIEFWHSDILRPDYRPLLQEYDGKLR